LQSRPLQAICSSIHIHSLGLAEPAEQWIEKISSGERANKVLFFYVFYIFVHRDFAQHLESLALSVNLFFLFTSVLYLWCRQGRDAYADIS